MAGTGSQREYIGAGALRGVSLEGINLVERVSHDSFCSLLSVLLKFLIYTSTQRVDKLRRAFVFDARNLITVLFFVNYFAKW